VTIGRSRRSSTNACSRGASTSRELSFLPRWIDADHGIAADIKACFDEIDHTALLQRVRRRVADKRILHLVKAFLKAGILSEDGVNRNTITGNPATQGRDPLTAAGQHRPVRAR
jgi:hypothetical protein